jgi:signal peptidase II
MDKNKRRNIIFLITAILLIVLDQVSKLLIKQYFTGGMSHHNFRFGESIPIIGTFIQFTFTENPGMAFGIEFGALKVLLSLFSLVASICLTWYLLKIKDFSPWVQLGVALILAGAFGNMVDRIFYGIIFGTGPIFYGKVVDFIQAGIHFGGVFRSWPIFNVADSCVTVGVILLLFVYNKIPTLKDLKSIRAEEIVDKANFVSDELEEKTIV